MNMSIPSHKYRRCMNNAQQINWDIEKDVIRERQFDSRDKFLPDGLSFVGKLPFLSEADRRFFSHVQGRSYAYIFGLVERFIGAKVIELSNEHALGDQDALAAMLQFGAEELKHQELFRTIETMVDRILPAGYAQTADPNDVAIAVLSKSSWAVLALTCHIEIFTQVHYLESIRDAEGLSPLYKDIFKYHWLEESQHATLDELEWERIHTKLSDSEIDQGVDELIDLVVAVDGVVEAQAVADANYFINHATATFDPRERAAIRDVMLRAYRFQYIVSGVQVERFQKALFTKLTQEQSTRVQKALAPIVEHVTVGVAPSR